jgi:formate dehydrogenase (NADP+) beta subunit
LKPTDIKNFEYFHKVIDCQYACPTHTQVPEYIRLIAEGRYSDAYMVNWHSNQFPGILGRVCDRPCEPACRRGRVDEAPVAICRLKRVCSDNREVIKHQLPKIPTEKNGKKIALIGGGPASLTVAADLMPMGYEVDLYDDQEEAGGFVRSQVPSFRLPKEVLDEEVNYILDMGVTTHLKTYVSSLKDFLTKGYDAIFIGTGAPRGRDLPDLPGRVEGDANIYVGIEWLAAVQYRHIKNAGNTTLVIGGGNTAMDCCRTAGRLGSNDVRIIIRGSQADMKASPWEIEDALREDIPILEYLTPHSFVVEEGKLKGMNFASSKAKDSNSKLIFIACDEVLLAVGQLNAFPWIEKETGIIFDDYGLPQVHPITHQSNIENIFFGGDAAFGPANIITAVAHGHQAALSIHLFCKGKDVTERPIPDVSLAGQKMGTHDWLYHNQVSDDDRFEVPLVSKAKSIKDRMLEVELGFDQDVGFKEALRCLNCDVQTVFHFEECIECDACVDICPTNCITFTENGKENELRKRLLIPARNAEQDLYVSAPLNTGRVMVKDENVCLHCSLCAERCPTDAWEMQKYIYKTAKAGK